MPLYTVAHLLRLYIVRSMVNRKIQCNNGITALHTRESVRQVVARYCEVRMLVPVEGLARRGCGVAC